MLHIYLDISLSYNHYKRFAHKLFTSGGFVEFQIKERDHSELQTQNQIVE